MHPERWHTVRGLFDELVELDLEARMVRLAEISGEDPELHDRLATLLAADAVSSGGVRWGGAPDHAGWKEQAPGDLLGLTGRAVSHFLVQQPLAVGGMGVVYRAKDVRLSRAVALKFPLPHLHLDQSSRTRFLREARAIAKLDHPNICTIYDVGESSEGYLFIAMPLYDGETLADRLQRQGALPVDETVRIAQQITAGLSRAHTAGVVHGDLKPSNIMLAPDGTAKLLDFGLARSADSNLSVAGVAVGTLPYMAPEQLVGGPVDPRTDLWALGVVLYQMLTGTRPFQTSHALSDPPVGSRVGPTPPSRHHPQIPSSLDACVLRLLERDPRRRYSSAADLLSKLSSLHMSGGPAMAPAARDRGKAVGGFRSRHRAAALTAGLLGVVTIAALAVRWQSAAEPRPPSIAVLPFQNFAPGLEADPIAEGLHDDVLTQLAAIGSIRVASRDAVAPYIDSDRTHRHIADALGVATLLEGTIRRIGDELRINLHLIEGSSGDVVWAGSYETDAAGLLTVHREIVATIASRLSGELSKEDSQGLARRQAKDAGALEAYWLGRFHSNRLTPPDLRIALDAYDRALAIDSTFAPAWAGRSVACLRAFVGMVVEELAPCIAAAETAVRLDGRLSEAHAALAEARMYGWDWDRSEDAFRRALTLDSTYAPARQGYGTLLRMLDRPAEAEQQFRRAATENPENLLARTQVGWVLFDQHRFEEALAAYDEVIGRDPTYWLPVYNKGLVYAVQRDSARLRATMERVAPLTQEGAPHVALLQGLLNAIRGERNAALAMLDRSCGGEKPARCVIPRATVLHALGDDEAALSLLERAADTRDPFLPNSLAEPWFDDLNDNPRLAVLRRRAGVERR